MIMNRETNPGKNKTTNSRFLCMILKVCLKQAQSKRSQSKSEARVMQERSKQDASGQAERVQAVNQAVRKTGAA